MGINSLHRTAHHNPRWGVGVVIQICCNFCLFAYLFCSETQIPIRSINIHTYGSVCKWGLMSLPPPRLKYQNRGRARGVCAPHSYKFGNEFNQQQLHRCDNIYSRGGGGGSGRESFYIVLLIKFHATRTELLIKLIFKINKNMKLLPYYPY